MLNACSGAKAIVIFGTCTSHGKVHSLPDIAQVQRSMHHLTDLDTESYSKRGRGRKRRVEGQEGSG